MTAGTSSSQHTSLASGTTTRVTLCCRPSPKARTGCRWPRSIRQQYGRTRSYRTTSRRTHSVGIYRCCWSLSSFYCFSVFLYAYQTTQNSIEKITIKLIFPTNPTLTSTERDPHNRTRHAGVSRENVRPVCATNAGHAVLRADHEPAGRLLRVGVQDNNQNVMNLQAPGCLAGGTPMHEMMHILGFLHEVSRPDRDDYIYVNRSALEPRYQSKGTVRL